MFQTLILFLVLEQPHKLHIYMAQVLMSLYIHAHKSYELNFHTLMQYLIRQQHNIVPLDHKVWDFALLF